MSQSTSRLIVVVVGVGPGLGAALARRFAAGYAVAVLARRESYLSDLVKDIEAGGGHALAVPTDVSQEEQINAAFARIRPAHFTKRWADSRLLSRRLRLEQHGSQKSRMGGEIFGS